MRQSQQAVQIKAIQINAIYSEDMIEILILGSQSFKIQFLILQGPQQLLEIDKILAP